MIVENEISSQKMWWTVSFGDKSVQLISHGGNTSHCKTWNLSRIEKLGAAWWKIVQREMCSS